MIRTHKFLRNPIIRRIRRHASFSTLLRTYEPEYGPYVAGLTDFGTTGYRVLMDTLEEPLIPGEPGAQPSIIVGSQFEPAPLPTPVNPVQTAPAIPAISQTHLPTTLPTTTPSPASKTAQALAEPKAGRFQLPRIFRKWQEKLSPEKKPTPTPVERAIDTEAFPIERAIDTEASQVERVINTEALPIETAVVSDVMRVVTAGPKEIPLVAPLSPPVPEIKTQPAIPTTSIPEPGVGLPATSKEAVTVPVSSQQPVQARLAAPQAKSGQPTPSVFIPRAPLPTSVSPEQPVSQGITEPDDPTWRRLQAIMRKHEQKKAAEAESTLPSVPSEAVQASSTADSGVASTSSPSAVQKSSKTPLTTRPAAKPNASRQAPTIEEFSPEREQVDQLQEDHSLEPEAIEQTQVLPLQDAWPVQRMESRSASPLQTTTPSAPTIPVSPAVPTTPVEMGGAIREIVEQTKTGQPTDSHVEVIMPRSPRPVSPAKATPLASPRVSPTEEQVETPTSLPEEQVETPTSPQRYQPTGITDRSAAETPESSKTELPATSIQQESKFIVPLENAIMPGIPHPEPVKKPNEFKPLRSVVPSEPVERPEQRSADIIQRREEDQGAMPQSLSKEMAPEGFVPTEIGPLPRDLWRLIGQQPPGEEISPVAQVKDQAIKSIQARPSESLDIQPSESVDTHPGLKAADSNSVTHTQSRLPDIQAQANLQSTSSLPKQAHTSQSVQRRDQGAAGYEEFPGTIPSPAAITQAPASQTSNVQRDVSPEPTGSSAPSSAPAPERSGEAATQLSEEELNTLARQVYAEIQQKLSIERERIRKGKF